jgi:K+-sensing histidine kinase KdpD
MLLMRAQTHEWIYENWASPQTSHIRGTGLGLYMARGIARRHGGDIVVTSAVRHGTTFTVTLPLSPAGPSRPAGRQRSARTDQ